MRIETLDDYYHGDFPMLAVFLAGLLVIGAIVAACFLCYTIYANALFISILEVLGAIAVGFPTVWLIGHVTIRTLSERSARCGCQYEYRYFFTEWLHKRKCLAFKLNG